MPLYNRQSLQQTIIYCSIYKGEIFQSSISIKMATNSFTEMFNFKLRPGTKFCFNSLKISLLVFSTSSAATSRLFQTPISKTSVFSNRETYRANLTRLTMISSGVFAGFCRKGVRSLLPTAKTT